jgi:glyoxylase-like metal-dependent hydrolase (beta-lactamase superfamily II)
MRIFEPAPNVLAFYDGRPVDGELAGPPLTWVEDGALSLGIASYAIFDGDEALIYDTHVSVGRARIIRSTLEARGATRFTVVLSHWHLDHVAGTAAFADCEVIATERTLGHLAERKEAIESGTLEGPPAINPLILPGRTITDRTEVTVGRLRIELIPTEIHSDDALLLRLPEQRLLLAGDALEDTVTYVGEPDRLEFHLENLARLHDLAPATILPNHGSPDRIAAGGYPEGLIDAAEQYVEALLEQRRDPQPEAPGISDLLSGPLEAGWISEYEPYESIHRANWEMVSGGT